MKRIYLLICLLCFTLILALSLSRLPSATTTAAPAPPIIHIIPPNDASGFIYPSGTLNLPIPDQTTISTTINVPDNFTLADTNIYINISHSWLADLTLTLEAPDGSQTILTANNGGNQDNYTHTTFDDEAACAIDNTACAQPPYTGRFQPEQPLTPSDGRAATGDWTLWINDNSDADTGTLHSWSLDLTPDNSCTTYYSTDTPLNIPSQATTTSIINVPDNFNVAQVRPQLNLAHTADSDLTLTLVSPNGTQTTLSANNGGLGDNYLNTLFDDYATCAINNTACATPPYSGQFQPQQPLTPLTGQAVNGNWQLRVNDNAAGDDGQLIDWALTLCPLSDADVTLNYTVGLNPSTCADTSSINVPPNTTVYHCYTIVNNSTTTLTRHDLESTPFGTILDDFPLSLIPTASAQLTRSQIITQNSTSSALWTAYNPGPTDIATATAQVDITVIPPSINFFKTVGLDKGSCGSDHLLYVQPGTTVYPCFSVTNTGATVLTRHDLDDDMFGQLLDNFPLALPPNATALFTRTTVVNAPSNASATWIAYNNGTNGPTNIASDTDNLVLGLYTPTIFPTTANFEAGTIPSFIYPVITRNNDAIGRVQVTTNQPHNGQWAIDLDTNCNPCGDLTTQAFVIAVNLSGQSEVALNFWAYNHGEETNPEDGIFISDDAGQTYDRIFDLNIPEDQYTQIVIDLDEAATNAGRSLNNQFRIKFQTRDNSPLGTDGFSFDDLHLETPAPQAATNPTSLDVTLFTDQQTTLPLTLTNYGSAPLSWSVAEASANCTTPDEVSWLNTTPTNGNLPATDHTTLNVAINTTGLAIDTYTANVCLTTNDASQPIRTIPLTLHVVHPPDVSLNATTINTEQTINSQQTIPLTITNSGLGDLHWTLTTATSTNCQNTTIINWLTILPTTGTTGPDNNSLANVTINTTDLTLDTNYQAIICLNSNDPDQPTIPITLNLAVTGVPPVYLPAILKP
ncbi:MAG TPA: proprotein convertase P-domain-containing protein [Anaerolineae bacterium]|nr:proprotein convertase P-domain-containing protein [Anaerolineae bacterium]